MMQPVLALIRYMTTLEPATLGGAFIPEPVIVENFAPYLFSGADSLSRWAAGFAAHAREGGLSELSVRFGKAHDLSLSGSRAHFSLPTTWTGRAKGTGFVEDGGWSFVLVRDGSAWAIACYAWSVTAYRTIA
jgi:hypothetical protein